MVVNNASPDPYEVIETVIIMILILKSHAEMLDMLQISAVLQIADTWHIAPCTTENISYADTL